MSVLDYYNDYLDAFYSNAFWLYDCTKAEYYIVDFQPLDYKEWLFSGNILEFTFIFN